jgi:hypothetical protein
MKNLFCLIFLCFVGAYTHAQQSDLYLKEWLRIDSLFLNHENKAATFELNQLVQKAQQERNLAQQIKTLLFQTVKNPMDTSNTMRAAAAINRLVKATDEAQSPVKAVLQSVMGELFWQLSEVRYDKVNNDKKWAEGDVRGMNKAQLLEKALAYYTASLQDETMKQLPITILDALTLPNITKEDAARPTVYDFLAHRIFDFSSKQIYNLIYFEEVDFKTTNDFYAPTEVFTNIVFPKEASHPTTYLLLSTFQKLLRFHRNDADKTAFLDVERRRFSILMQNAFREERETIYLKGLNALIDTYGNTPSVVSLVDVLATFYRDKGDKYNNIIYGRFAENMKPENRFGLKKAYDLCDNFLKKYPNAYGKELLEGHLREMEKESLSIVVEEAILPHKPTSFYVEFRNIDTVFCRVVKISAKGHYDSFRLKDNLKITYYTKFSTAKTWTQPLPFIQDFQLHKTEIMLEGLPIGHYVLLVSDNADFEFDKGKGGNVCVAEMAVTNIAIGENQSNNLLVVHRETGKPLSNVLLGGSTKPNTEGVVKKPDFATSDLAVWGADSLYIPIVDDRDKDDEQYTYKVQYFMDRNIYRPTQTIYFKGVLVHKKMTGQAKIWKNQKIRVGFSKENDEYNPIDTLILKTNAFGSFSGSFKAPANGQLGAFQIHTIPYFKTEKQEEAFDDTYDIDDRDISITFQIEEYKRPRFELVFDPKTQAYKLGDTVKIHGQVKALAGSPVDGIPIEYNLSQYLQSSFPKNKKTVSNNRSYGSHALKTDTLITDANGAFTIVFASKPRPQDSALVGDFHLNYSYTINAKATDLNGETHENSENVQVNSSTLHFYLSLPTYINRKKDMPIPLSLAFGNDIKQVLKGSVKIEQIIENDVFRDERDTFLYDETTYLKYFPDRVYRFKKDKQKEKDTVLVFENTFNSAKEKAVILRGIENWAAGKYTLTITVFDPDIQDSITKSATFTLIDFNKKAFPKSNDLKVLLSKSDYYVGETMKMYITAPHTVERSEIPNTYGEGYVWVELVRNEKVFKSGWVTLKNGLAEYTYTLKEHDRIGFSYRVSMVKNNNNYSDDDVIRVRQDDKNLQIEVITFRNRLAPNDNETWTFRITDRNKKATDAEMVATLYDASLDLLKDNSPLDWQWKNNDRYEYDRLSHMDWSDMGLHTSKSVKPLSEKYTYSRLRDSFFSYSPRKIYWFDIDVYKGGDKNLLDFFKGDAAAGAAIWLLRGSPHYRDGRFINPYINVLSDSSLILDGVTVTGYGMVKKKDMTGSVSEIRIRGLSSFNHDFNPNANYMLNGKTAGVSINSEIAYNIFNKYSDKTLSEVVVVGYGTIKKPRPIDENLPATIKARTNLNETVFFFPHIQTDAEGKVELTFTMNEALTRWRFLAFAHTKDLKTGSLNQTVVTQKDLMVFPNMPRFLRAGDEIELAVKISNLKKNDAILRGVSQIQFFDANTMQPIDNQLDIKQNKVEWTAQAGLSTVIKWRIKVPETESLQALTWRVLAKADNLSDGEESTIPILPRRILLTESLPFVLNPKNLSANGQNTEGPSFVSNFNNLEQKNPTMQPYSWSVDIVTNPLWQVVTALHYAKEYPYECSEQLFSRYYANALAHKILKENPSIKDFLTQKQATNKAHQTEVATIRATLQEESPWLFASESFDVEKLAPLFDTSRMVLEQKKALEKLILRANNNGGFSWFPQGEISPFITQHVLAGFGHLNRLGIGFDKKIDIERILNRSIQYLDTQMVYFFKDKTIEKRYAAQDTALLLHYLYARSFYPKQLISNDLQKSMDTTLFWTKRRWLDLSRYDKTLLSLILNRKGDKKAAQQIANYLKTEKEPDFWTTRNYRYWYEMPVETMSLMIEMFEEVTQDTPSVFRLKTRLLSQLEDGHWYSTKATTEAVYALMMLGKEAKTVKNEVVLIETSNSMLKKEALKAGQKENFIHITLKGDDVKKDLNKTLFTNTSELSLNGSVTLRYIENMDKVAAFSSDTFTTLQKHIFRMRSENGSEKLDSLTANDPLGIGDRLRVRLTIKIGKRLEYVHLKDTRPAAFEPVDVLSEYTYISGAGCFKTTRDVSTNYFFDALNEGKYEFTYDTTVQQRGTFVGGMASMECMYAPNMALHTEGVVVKVE